MRDLFVSGLNETFLRRNIFPSTSRYAWESNQKNTLHPHQEPNKVWTGHLPKKRIKNPFFIRNRPHPTHVKHMKGLCDIPVCVVFNSSPDQKITLNMAAFKPKLREQKSDKRFNFKVGLGSMAKKEKAVPGIGLVLLRPFWLSELQKITDATYEKALKGRCPKGSSIIRPWTQGGRCPTLANRLSPSANQILSRQGYRPKPGGEKSQAGVRSKSEDSILEYPDEETYVFHVLAAILDAEYPEEVQEWLEKSEEREKEILIQMMRALFDSEEQNLQQATGRESASRGLKSRGQMLTDFDAERMSLSTAPPASRQLVSRIPTNSPSTRSAGSGQGMQTVSKDRANDSTNSRSQEILSRIAESIEQDILFDKSCETANNMRIGDLL